MLTETILVVDDSEETRSFLSDWVLEPAGYRVPTAADGDAAIRVAVRKN